MHFYIPDSEARCWLDDEEDVLIVSCPSAASPPVCLFPTDPFTNLELLNPWHDVPELHKIYRYPNIEALKMWKGRSGLPGHEALLLRACRRRTALHDGDGPSACVRRNTRDCKKCSHFQFNLKRNISRRIPLFSPFLDERHMSEREEKEKKAESCCWHPVWIRRTSHSIENGAMLFFSFFFSFPLFTSGTSRYKQLKAWLNTECQAQFYHSLSLTLESLWDGRPTTRWWHMTCSTC